MRLTVLHPTLLLVSPPFECTVAVSLGISEGPAGTVDEIVREPVVLPGSTFVACYGYDLPGRNGRLYAVVTAVTRR